jgi:hypothetical protein
MRVGRLNHEDRSAAGLVWLVGGLAMLASAYCLPWCLLAVHGASAVNYVCHSHGRQRYATGDGSTNHPVLGVILPGEGWHNNHHHYPRAARAPRSCSVASCCWSGWPRCGRRWEWSRAERVERIGQSSPISPPAGLFASRGRCAALSWQQRGGDVGARHRQAGALHLTRQCAASTVRRGAEANKAGMMKATRAHQFGPPSVLLLDDVPDPGPGAGQVLVQIKAAGVNPADHVRALGELRAAPNPTPQRCWTRRASRCPSPPSESSAPRGAAASRRTRRPSPTSAWRTPAGSGERRGREARRAPRS